MLHPVQLHVRPRRTVLLTVLSALILAWAPLAFAQGDSGESRIIKPTRINVAEAILDPFFDPEITTFDEWTVEDGQSYGLTVYQHWFAVNFEWASVPLEGPVLRMTRRHNARCHEYDKLLVRMTPPQKTKVRVIAVTDRGEVSQAFTTSGDADEYEYAMDLQGATLLKSLTFELTAGAEGPATGWIKWVGLQNSKRVPLYLRRWDYSGMYWDKHLRKKDEPIAFKPKYSIFMTPKQLEDLRAEHQAAVEATGESPYAHLVEEAKTMDIEAGIHEFAQSGGRDKGRARDAGQARLPGGTALARAGLVLKDRSLLVAAGRYALSLAVSDHWDNNFTSQYPGGPQDMRAFRRSYTCEDIAEILDVAGEIFSEGGRRYLMRRLAEEGIGPINYITWRHDYIYNTNQMAFFNYGRMCACLVLEREMPRVKPYTELALKDTLTNLDLGILPDGGYQEGPNYFGAFARRNYEILELYARARGLEVASVVPDSLRRTDSFAKVIASTTEADVIPMGDSELHVDLDTLDAMVELMPGSYWVTMANKKRRHEGLPLLPGPEPTLPHFISLPDMGTMASVREVDGEKLKIFLFGNKIRSDHCHEDKGGFVLEFAGQAFALDLGCADYSDPLQQLYKHAQRHNMLVPVGMAERPHPPIILMADVKPTGSGDAQTFDATIDATPGWDGYYKKWIRTWHAPRPDRLVIRDEYELAKGTGVEFLWQTKLPCTVRNSRVIISGERGQVTLTPPRDCAIRIDRLPLSENKEYNRIAIGKDGTEGILEVVVEFAVRKAQ